MLEAREVVAGYSSPDKADPVLRGIDFTAEPGGITALIGPNGSGKSTLLRVLSGLLRPFSGQALWEGRDLSALPERERARLVAVVPQNPELAPGLTALEFTLMGRYARSGALSALSGYTRADRRKAEAALASVAATPLAGRLLGKLSGGERQRIFVARALAQETPVLLLDEPSGSLDPGRGAALFDLLARLCREKKLCVVAAMHDVNMAAIYCDKFFLLREGLVLSSGSPQETLRKELLEEAYQASLAVVAHPEYERPQILPMRAV